MRRHLALVGFMAAGKSTIGKKLARKVGCAFYDIDDLVVRDHGPVADIFYDEGEPAFRAYEYAAVARAIEEGESGVLALGGGALTNPETLALVKKRTYRVFIKISPEQALERLRRSKRIRPLLGPTPSLTKIKELYTRRMPLYAHSDFVVEGDHITTTQSVDAIVQWLNKKKIAI